MAAPRNCRIRMYNVGFGDCFLLTFRYARAPERHVLIDFGSSAAPERRDSQMQAAAEDIEKVTGGRLDAVIATHRHLDHISGFEPRASGNGPGDIIRRIGKKALVVQPWTEDPKLETKARTRPGARRGGRSLAAMKVLSLDAMHSIADAISQRVAALPADLEDDAEEAEGARPQQGQAFVGGAVGIGKQLAGRLAFLGQTNLKNLGAVKNLQTMSRRHEYLSYGVTTKLTETVLPGVKVHVLGPPTLDQHDAIRSYAKESAEYWSMQAMAGRVSSDGAVDLLFPEAAYVRGDDLPKATRWLVRGLRTVHAQQMQELVRIIDDTLNNTSLILLFEFKDKLLLFPGDAQFENWDYALNHAPDAEKNRALLARTDVYKVGHHGSLNATPKSLWALFEHKPQIKTLLSTRHGKHGHRKSDTEVPRDDLVDELVAHSELHNTVDCNSDNDPLVAEVVI